LPGEGGVCRRSGVAAARACQTGGSATAHHGACVSRPKLHPSRGRGPPPHGSARECRILKSTKEKIEKGKSDRPVQGRVCARRQTVAVAEEIYGWCRTVLEKEMVAWWCDEQLSSASPNSGRRAPPTRPRRSSGRRGREVRHMWVGKGGDGRGRDQ
jgi:hypothetical protein